MAVSGVTAFAMTARDMVTQAMRELAVLPSGEDPSADELTDGIFRLNSMLKSWQAQGVNLWREEDRSVTVTAATATVALSGDNADIRQVFGARHIGDYERVLGQWEREDYLALPNKATIGNPTIFYASRGRDNITLYVWPVPSTDQTLKLDCERIVNTVTDAGQDVDVPTAWHETVWVNLASRMISMFGVDPVRAQEVRDRARELYGLMLDDDRPQSVFIGACQ